MFNSSIIVPKGIELNNPGMLPKGEPWNGLTEEQPPFNLCRFSNIKFGIRAIALSIIEMYDKSNKECCTITDIVNKWFDTYSCNEYDRSLWIPTAVYYMEQMIPVHEYKLDCHSYSSLFPLVKAIIIACNGRNGDKDWISDDIITEGILMSGATGVPHKGIFNKSIITAITGHFVTIMSILGVVLLNDDVKQLIMDLPYTWIPGVIPPLTLIVLGWKIYTEYKLSKNIK